MTDGEELGAWLRLCHIPGLGGEGQRLLLKTFGLPTVIFDAGRSALAAVIGLPLAEALLTHDSRDAVSAALDWNAQPGNRILTLADPDYPQSLLLIDDPPVLLYVKGRVEALNRPAVAIVGSRNATPQGERDAEAFARNLAESGLVIVSGMALGIDAAAHRGALLAGGNQAATVAVIGTGADRIYPARNEALARAIVEGGAIVSEFRLGTAALSANFPRRNRLIAGLGMGCLVVEAALRSGSLITARLAAEAGRDVFAIPGSIHSPLSRGCHQLIRQGAKLVESAQDILEELRGQLPEGKSPRKADKAARSKKAEASKEEQVLTAMGLAPISLESLMGVCGLSAADLLAMLLPLELEGRIAQLPGGLYQRIHSAA